MHYCIDTEKIIWRIIDNEAIILNLDSGHYYSLNNTGSLIWRLLSEKKTPQHIIEQLLERYRIPQEEARRDVASIIKAFKKEGLIIDKRKRS